VRVLISLLFTLSCFSETLNINTQARAMAFEARGGQYVSRGPGYTLSVTASHAVLSLGGHDVRMSIPGGSPKSSLEAFDRMPGKANYLLGRDVRASYDLYGRVRWRGVYPGINVVFRGNQDHLEYDFEIDAGRDSNRIRVAFDGVDGIHIDPNGDLVLTAGTIQIHQPKPVAYQDVAGQRRPVDVAYRIDASNRVRFRTGAYDHERPLVIDPQLVFDKSFGGSGMSTAAGIARDTQGNLYVAGSTDSTDFATVNPEQSHLGTAPLLVSANAGQTWSLTSLGPADLVSAIAAAPSAPMVIYAATPIGIFQSLDGGTTWTPTVDTGLPGGVTSLAVDAGSSTTVYAATAQAIFVSTDGGASWRDSTNIGILGSAGVLAIAAHPTQSGILFASVQNPPALFRTTNGGQSWTQLTVVPPSQTLSAVTGIAIAPNGTVIAASNNGLLISTDGGNTWTTGATSGVQGVLGSTSLAVAPGSPFTLYLLNAPGLERSTDGGQTFTVVLPTTETANSSQTIGLVAVDPRNAGTVYAIANVFSAGASPQSTVILERSTDSGQTWTQVSLPYNVNTRALFVGPADSRIFVAAGTFNNVFVTKWSPDGSQVLYSTYLGGSGGDTATGIAVDSSGSAYITGVTSSPDFPTTAGAFNTKLSNAPNIFAAKLSADGSHLAYSTLIGSGAAVGGGIAVDGSGDAVITGLTRGNFPVTPNAYQGALPAGCTGSQFNAGAAFVTRVAADGKSLVYSTYFGGSCPNLNVPAVSPATYGASVAIDTNGNAWIAGSTLSTDFPATSDALQSKFGGGIYDGFLARFNPSGSLGYATYLGGAGYDTISAIAIDQSGNIYLTGESAGLTQPASAGAYQAQVSANCPVIAPGSSAPVGNGLVLKLDPAAHSVLRLTYLGAPLCLVPSSIAVDSAGEPWIGGGVQFYPSAPPTVSPFEIGIGQGFISKFSADFTQLLFSSYFNPVAGIALDSSGLAYVAGTVVGTVDTGTQPVYAAKIDSTPPAISLDSIASFVPPLAPSSFPGIAPGEVIRILGQRMGPAAATSGVISGGLLASNVAGVEVIFDGTPVPLLSVSAQEIDLVAPFELATKSSTTIQVQYNNQQSNPVLVGVVSAAPQILGVFNSDFTANSASNPAKAGSIVSLYLAGVGQSNPASQDGQVNAPPLAALPTLPLIEWFGGGSITGGVGGTIMPPITAAVAAPGLAAGIFQVNFVAPQQSLEDLLLRIANNSAQFNVFVQ
jgi:uncharacterized protein (TIGR03437 family)